MESNGGASCIRQHFSKRIDRSMTAGKQLPVGNRSRPHDVERKRRLYSRINLKKKKKKKNPNTAGSSLQRQDARSSIRSCQILWKVPFVNERFWFMAFPPFSGGHFFSRRAVGVNRRLKNGSLGSRTCRHYSSYSHVYEHLLWWKCRMINKWTRIKSAAFASRRLVALAATIASSPSGPRWK